MTNVTTQDGFRNAAIGTTISFSTVGRNGTEKKRDGLTVVSNHESSVDYGVYVEHVLLTTVSKRGKKYVVSTHVEDETTLVDMMTFTGLNDNGEPATVHGFSLINNQALVGA